MAKRRRPRPRLRPKQREVLPTNMVSVTLHAGETLSDPLNATQGSIEYLIAPDDWTPAPLTFQISFDLGATWYDLLDFRGEDKLIEHATPAAALDIRDKSLKNVTLRLRSGMPDNPKPQAADRVFMAVIGP